MQYQTLFISLYDYIHQARALSDLDAAQQIIRLLSNRTGSIRLSLQKHATGALLAR
jgi:hypothetical protein